MFGKIKGAAPLAAAKGLIRAGKFDGACKALETYLGTDPESEEGNLLWGKACGMRGHKDAALAVFEFLAELAPKRGDGWREASAIRRRKGISPVPWRI